MKKNIHTLQELREEQFRLKIQSEATKQLFLESMGRTRSAATDYLLKGVLLPLGAAGFTAWGAKKVFTNNQTEAPPRPGGQTTARRTTKSTNNKDLLTKLMPLAISLFNTYMNKKTVREEIKEEPTVPRTAPPVV